VLQLLDKLGRKRIAVLSFAICGAMCLVCSLLPAASKSPTVVALRVASAVGGKFGGAAAFITLYVYTIELFPTVVRNAALGANSSAARLGAVLAPVVVLVAEQLNFAVGAFFVFGLASFVAGTLIADELVLQGCCNESSARAGARAARARAAAAAALLCRVPVYGNAASAAARAGGLCMLMPETQGEPLLDRLEDVPGHAGQGPTLEALDAAMHNGGTAEGDERFVLTDDKDELPES
jgi:MFS family permease